VTRVDLLFLARNRRAFTIESFEQLVTNTDWSEVKAVTLWDDGSEDGTAEWLHAAGERLPAPWRYVQTDLGSPVEVMAQWIARADAPILAKVDNDAVMPVGWLGAAISVLDRAPELTFLGIEAHAPPAEQPDRPRSYQPAAFISGLGLYHRAAFETSLPRAHGRWYGFEDWQRQAGARVRAGWIDPALDVFLLDRLPFEPWLGLTDAYVARGWQRRWPEYSRHRRLWAWRWRDEPARPYFDVVILSASARNLVSCVRRLLALEPDLAPERIIVVDDGARAQAEAAIRGVRWVPGSKPFNFARNVNIGIAASGRNVVLLNDDAELAVAGGLSRLAGSVGSSSIVSAAIRGVVGNPNQRPHPGHGLRIEDRMLCFVCVYLPRAVIDRVGPLDERFTGYGFEDDDYCLRARRAGVALAIDDGCVVDHAGRLPSSFRRRADHHSLFRANQAIYARKQAEAELGRFLGVMRVKNEAPHIGEAIESLRPLCHRVLVLDDHSTDPTPEICRALGCFVSLIPSPFEGLDEARDKNFLLELIAEEQPEWVVWIDGDEVLEQAGTAAIRRAASDRRGYGILSLQVTYLWDDPKMVRTDGIFGRMRRPSVFRYYAEDAPRLRFPETGGANLHCGNVPRGARGPVAELAVRLKHYGYLSPEMRQRKYAWYRAVDPDNAAEDDYRHLAGLPGARFAPGRPVLAEWKD
jgi:glycosyltransferase involved in cell wall biosynthesis